jgi:CRISPR system Cascade subunit CasA
VWRRGPVEKGQPSETRPRRHTPGRAAWRGLESLIALSLPIEGEGLLTSSLLRQLAGMHADDHIPADYPVDIEVHGFKYGTQSSIFEDNIFDSTPLPILALSDESGAREAVSAVVDQAGKLEFAVNVLSGDLRRAAGGEPLPWDKGQRPGVELIHALDPIARRFLADLRRVTTEDQIEELLFSWEREAGRAAWAVAEQLLAQQPPQTFLGREVDAKHIYRAATAQRSFQFHVAKVLSRAAAARTRDEGDM